jgi:hypothetical protein
MVPSIATLAAMRAVLGEPEAFVAWGAGVER